MIAILDDYFAPVRSLKCFAKRETFEADVVPAHWRQNR
jgi:hypothetical protein